MQPSKLHNFKLKPLGDEDEWIISYADMVTLLLCFFILFFNQAKKIEHENLIESLANRQSELEADIESIEKNELLKTLEKEMTTKLKDIKLERIKYEISNNESELLVRFWDKNFFSVGSSRISADGKAALIELGSIIAKKKKPMKVVVEGHSDSMAWPAKSSYSNNIVLSNNRASVAAWILLKTGVPENILKTEAFGSNKLLVNDINPDGTTNRAVSWKNRRIEIRIVPEGH
jgi:chemotaxis protein MotB